MKLVVYKYFCLIFIFKLLVILFAVKFSAIFFLDTFEYTSSVNQLTGFDMAECYDERKLISDRSPNEFNSKILMRCFLKPVNASVILYNLVLRWSSKYRELMKIASSNNVCRE